MGTARGGVPPEGPLRITAIVSVQIKPPGHFRIIAPCGVCRELISDYSPDTRVWVTTDEGIISVAALDLLAHKSQRAW
jgi:cytidine deaminase